MKTLVSPFHPAPTRLPATQGGRKGAGGDRCAGRTQAAPAVSRRVQLLKDKFIRLDRDSGVSGFTVEHGTVWITETPANGDLLAREGGYVRLRGGWPVLVQALTEASLTLNGEPADE
jgi:hypothetical protein